MADNPNNLALWQTLSKTDPYHTKGFKRAGGFSGTAIKPMWVWKRLTEQYGPFGTGWGCDEPKFTVTPAGEEVLVYCTVRGWYEHTDNSVWGVGGDKVVSKSKYGLSSDDEAFKKAYTDALMNAFKYLGVGADVHMGLFDDSKYVEQMEREFNPPADKINAEQLADLEETAKEVGADVAKFAKFMKVATLADLTTDKLDAAKAALENKRKGGQ